MQQVIFTLVYVDFEMNNNLACSRDRNRAILDDHLRRSHVCSFHPDPRLVHFTVSQTPKVHRIWRSFWCIDNDRGQWNQRLQIWNQRFQIWNKRLKIYRRLYELTLTYMKSTLTDNDIDAYRYEINAYWYKMNIPGDWTTTSAKMLEINYTR